MTNPVSFADHRRLPRKKRAPSSRDHAIYLAYKTTGVSQAKLAEDNHLSQRRISAIITRVERWRANLIPAAAGELDHHQSQRLERWLEQQRLQAVFDRAIRDYDTQQLELKTTRNGDRDGKPYHDETTHQVPRNVQLLKVAIRASESLGKLNDKPAPAASQPKTAEQRFWQLQSLILDLRRDHGHPEIGLLSREAAALTAALHDLIHKQPASPPNPKSPIPNPKSPICNSQLAICNSDPPASSAPEPEVGCISEAQCTTAEDSNCSNPAPHEISPDAIDEPTPTSAPTTTLDLGPTTSDPRSPAPKKSPPPAVGCISEAQCTTAADSTLNIEPETLNSARPSPAERRRRHYEKIAQLEEARRRGLPCLIEFDPEDGPIPPTYYQLDGVGYSPPCITVPGPW